METYQKTRVRVKCPVCDADQAYRLWSASSSQAAQHFVLLEKYPERFSTLVLQIENLWQKNSCEVVQCKLCGFCYSNPYIAGDSQFYELACDRSRYPSWKWEFQITYDTLKQFSKPDMTLLEIGAGDGAFIKAILNNDLLSKNNIFCTEFSDYGRHQIEKLGVKCFSEDIRDLRIAEWEQGFDIVCMFQVLEHMDRLDILFQKLAWLIKKDGSLFIAVPNQKMIEFNELNGALLDMPPNHIGRWNKECFQIIGNRNGFHIVDYKVEELTFVSMAKQFATYRYLRNSQKSCSFENKIEKIKNRHLNKAMKILGAGINLILAIPAIIKANAGMGNSQWVHLKKNNT